MRTSSNLLGPCLWQQTLPVPHSDRSWRSSSSSLCVDFSVSASSLAAASLLRQTASFCCLLCPWLLCGLHLASAYSNLCVPASVLTAKETAWLTSKASREDFNEFHWPPPFAVISLDRSWMLTAQWATCLPVFATEKPGLQKGF